MEELPLSGVYQIMEPGPVVFLTTAAKGQPNVMTMSWHMMVDFEPPLFACVMSDRNYTWTTVRRSGQCVIAIPTVELARTVVACGECSGRDVDKFQAFGLTPRKASVVEAPLIEECYANLECELSDARMASRYGMLIWEVKKAWVDRGRRNPRTIHHAGHGEFVADGRRLKLPSRVR